MKKISLIFLFSGQLLFAQDNSSSHHYGNEDVFKNIILPLLIMIIVFTTIFYVIAYSEGSSKKEDYAIKSINYEIWAWLITFILIVTGLLYLLYISNINPYLAVIPVKIIVASVVCHYAKKKNRHPVLWWFLGFLEYHSALIALAIVKGLLPLKKSKSDADVAYNEKLIKLNDLFKEDLINVDEIEKKKSDLEEEYSKSSSLIQENNEKQQQNDFMIKLKEAYKQGFLTEEEYQSKILKHIPMDTNSKVNEEKEKFRRFYSSGMITLDEMEEKFRQIEKYHQLKNED
jgi:hypothetical protein